MGAWNGPTRMHWVDCAVREKGLSAIRIMNKGSAERCIGNSVFLMRKNIPTLWSTPKFNLEEHTARNAGNRGEKMGSLFVLQTAEGKQ